MTENTGVSEQDATRQIGSEGAGELHAHVRLLAACFALSGFAVSCVNGLANSAEARRILSTSIGAMFLCFLVGAAAGWAARLAVLDALERYRAARPVPDSTAPVSLEETGEEDENPSKES